jgi:pyruvate kinase
VSTLAAIIEDAELLPPHDGIRPGVDPTHSRHGRALCEAAVTLATTGRADAIVAVTTEGKTARLLSMLRPPAPIIAVTPSEDVAARLSLLRSVLPCVIDGREVGPLQQELLERRLVAPGAVLVFISVMPDLRRPDANFLTVSQAR